MKYFTRYSIANTGSAEFIYQDPARSKRIINLQLDAWIDARTKYHSALQNPSVGFGDIFPILSLLGQSLTTLFGMHYKKDGDSPQLMGYIKHYFKKEVGYDMEVEDPELFWKLTRLDECYKDLTKHMSAGKLEKAKALRVADLHEFMDTTQRTWIWFLNHLGIYADEQIDSYFRNTFIQGEL